MFEKIYRKFLANRLINQLSISNEYEEFIISELEVNQKITLSFFINF
jgi:hypothetical protein